MALISQGLFLSVQYVDSGGNKVRRNFDLNPAAAAFADLEALGSAAGSARIAAILTDLGLVSNARILGYSMGERFGEDTNFYGPSGSEVERIAEVVSRIDGEPFKYHTVKIPSPVPGLFVNDGAPGPDKNKIDPADTDLLAFMGHFQASLTDADPFTASFLVSDGEQIEDATASTITGKQIHRGSRKG